ncbi:replication protein [Clostridium sporogenes]|nr:replication protein [Clostridium sporogenes]NFH48989.1 replication protein [Clostridium sporogenes]NFM16253.1 replication protein [Clostridium sporogenes]NFQ04315.1 replication protein [Clostridium sporogenes]NFQ33269.1 replication protein [Clostridium sporogenes]
MIVSCQSRHISLFLNKGEYILIFSILYFKITITAFKVIKTRTTFRENKYLKK